MAGLPHHCGRAKTLCAYGMSTDPPPPPPPPRPGFTRNSVPVQSLAAGVRGSGRAPFVTVIHTKLRGQKTLARLCVC